MSFSEFWKTNAGKFKTIDLVVTLLVFTAIAVYLITSIANVPGLAFTLMAALIIKEIVEYYVNLKTTPIKK